MRESEGEGGRVSRLKGLLYSPSNPCGWSLSPLHAKHTLSEAATAPTKTPPTHPTASHKGPGGGSRGCARLTHIQVERRQTPIKKRGSSCLESAVNKPNKFHIRGRDVSIMTSTLCHHGCLCCLDFWYPPNDCKWCALLSSSLFLLWQSHSSTVERGWGGGVTMETNPMAS